MGKITCEEAKEKIDLVEYLDYLGHRPAKVSRQNYLYHSPLREDRTPSFSVNKAKGLWYDHGTGEGGSIIDFGTRYFRCSIPELLEKLDTVFHVHHYDPELIHSPALTDDGKVKILREEKLSSPAANFTTSLTTLMSG